MTLMEFFIGFGIWYLIGFFGSVLSWLINDDLTTNNLVAFLFLSFFGPLTAIVVFCVQMEQYLNNWNGSVIIRRFGDRK